MVIVDSISDEMPPAQQIQAKTMEPVLKDVIMEDAHDDLENNPKAAEAQSEANREDSAESNHIEDSYASTLSAADKKAEAQAQNKRMEMWLEANDNNLYPSRPDKEKLAEEMGVPLLTITRWFSNRRRKQSKRPKISTSAEDRNRHIEDIVDFVVQRANAESFSSPDPSSSDEKLDSATDESAATVTENNQKTPDMAEMMKFYDEVWIKALKMALSSTSWLQQTPQQQQPPEQQLQPEEPNKPEEPSEEQQPEKKAPKKSKKLKDAENKKEMVVNMPTSPISQLISAEALAGKDKSMLMRPQAEQHHGFVTPPPSVLPRIDSASSLVGGTPTSGYHQVPDLHHQSHGSPVLTPEHPSSLVGVPHHPLQQPHEVLSAQMQLFQASQQQQLFLQMAALNPAVIQQYQMYMMALQQQQQKLQQFQSPQNSSAASPFHVMPTTSHDVQVDIEASPPTPESFPGDIDTISMAMDTSDSGSSSSAQDQMIEEMDDDEIMSRIEKARLSDKEALAVLVLAGLANQ